MDKLCCSFDQSYEQKYEISSNSLNVVTLNYGGVLNNPFQFFSDDQLKEIKLSEVFCKLLPFYLKGYHPKDFQWDIGKIDLKLQAERYSPLYNPEVGIDQSKNRFFSSKDFQKLWDQNYHNSIKKTKITPQPTNQQIQNMKLFDLICYHTILSHVYRIQSNRTLKQLKPQTLNPQKYRNFMKHKFSKSFLNEKDKLIRVVNMLNQIDVAFVQQATEMLINRLKNDERFIVREKGVGNSMIVLRREKFIDKNKLVNLIKLPRLEQKNHLSFNGHQDVVYLCVDKMILISAHLSSKTAKNQPQVKAMRQFLNKLLKDFPGYKVVFGADANSFVDSAGFSGQFSIFPAKSSVITTRKKRTYLQPQFQKADRVVESCKDHIISTLQMVNQQVMTIGEKKLKGNQLLPTDQHPFDHFMVVCELQR